MRRNLATILPLLSVLVLAGACDDDDPVDTEGPFDLTFQGDATFQAPHGDQDISVALVDNVGTVVDVMSGTVSATADPAFSFTFTDQLTAGQSYAVHYWIDSNFGGGTEGTCDPPENDHQWNVALGTAQDDLTQVETHDPSGVTSVCDSF